MKIIEWLSSSFFESLSLQNTYWWLEFIFVTFSVHVCLLSYLDWCCLWSVSAYDGPNACCRPQPVVARTHLSIVAVWSAMLPLLLHLTQVAKEGRVCGRYVRDYFPLNDSRKICAINVPWTRVPAFTSSHADHMVKVHALLLSLFFTLNKRDR